MNSALLALGVFCAAVMACHRTETIPVRPALPDSTLSELDAQRMASALFVAVRSDSASPLLQAQTFCLALRDRAGRQFLDRSHATTWVLHRPIVAMHECPRTYASMFVRVDKQGRPMDPKPPKGHVDPHRITVGVPTTDWSAVRVHSTS